MNKLNTSNSKNNKKKRSKPINKQANNKTNKRTCKQNKTSKQEYTSRQPIKRTDENQTKRKKKNRLPTIITATKHIHIIHLSWNHFEHFFYADEDDEALATCEAARSNRWWGKIKIKWTRGTITAAEWKWTLSVGPPNKTESKREEESGEGGGGGEWGRGGVFLHTTFILSISYRWRAIALHGLLGIEWIDYFQI